MNSKQRSAMLRLWDRADTLEPEQHIIVRTSSPAMESLRCRCGWSAAQSRRQNALGREAKLDRALRAHAEAIIARHAPAQQTP